jgi:hypothetical protein
MKYRLLVLMVFLAGACGKSSKKESGPHPELGHSTDPDSLSEKDDFRLYERETDVLAQYREIGVALKFWSGQEPAKRDVEIKQLIDLLPEIQKRTDYVRSLEISPDNMHWYKNEAKILRLNLEPGVEAAVQYLRVFDKVRAYERQLSGTVLERVGETLELLEGDLQYYQKVNLVDLLHDRPYIKVIRPSGSMQYIESIGVLYIKTDATADQLKQRLEGIRKWYELSTELGIEIEDKTEDLSYNTFVTAVEYLSKKLIEIKPVLNLVKKIEIIRDFREASFDLTTGVFKLSRIDAANSDDLWLALDDYNRLSSTLGLPIEIPDYMRGGGGPLRKAFKLLLDNIDLINAKLDKIHSIVIGGGDNAKMNPGQVLWVAENQDADQFKAFLEAL